MAHLIRGRALARADQADPLGCSYLCNVELNGRVGECRVYREIDYKAGRIEEENLNALFVELLWAPCRSNA